MMKYHSEPDLTDIGKWPWSIVPTRAFGDKRLQDADRRVLGALCAFVNRAGVCWPALDTMQDIAGYATRKSVFDAIQRLKRAGYIRQLKPKDYQETKSGWKTNRYQVLWLGDEPMPTHEDINSAIRLQDESILSGNNEDIGVVGEDNAAMSLAHSLAHAYSHAIERALGQSRRPENELGAARMLAAQGVTVAQVIEATEAHARASLARRAGVPALADVARAMS
tara:strand:- start:576 stop:1244 length:669 start_codon:yes stop_codon:yes gene_type:complete